MVVKGGLHGQPGNPSDPTDEGVFISKINPDSVAEREKRLKVGQRIIEVNGQSLLGATHQEAVAALRNAGDHLHILLCDGFDTTLTSHDEAKEELDRVVKEAEEQLRMAKAKMAKEDLEQGENLEEKVRK